MPEVRIGTSGFSYDHWRGAFYPDNLAKNMWFGYYCKNFDTVELNVTFYRLPRDEALKQWRLDSPEGFSFALKGSRYITHIKRLKDPKEPLKTFMQKARLLKDKLGVVLWQLPPNFMRDMERLKGFLTALKKYRRRNAFEFRHESWVDEAVITLLEDENACMCMADWPPFIDDLPATADFTYIRRHGKGGNYDTLYSGKELEKDAWRIQGYLRAKRDVFVYFNNDAMGYAARNALELKELLGQ